LRHQKENAPCTVEKKKCSYHNFVPLRVKVGQITGVERIGAVENFAFQPSALNPGSRRSFKPHLAAWMQNRGGQRMDLLLFSLALCLPPGERQRGKQ
jgi:hypothetical protein